MILLRHSYILVLLLILNSTTTFSQTARLVGTGTLDGGTIYSINVDGNSPETFFDMRFGKNDYWQQPRLIEKNGKLYGVTTQGVSSRYGVIFRIDPDGLNYTEIFQFNGTNGHQPNASLIDINGKFYGTTWSGGSSNVGLIFSIDYDGFGFEIIHEFQAGSDDGEKPIGDLLEYNGALWGVTAGGGIDDGGTLFTVKLLDDSYTKIHDFDRELANNPSGSLIEIAGDLWGMSFWGGENSSGVIYKISLADTTYSNIHSFSSGSGPLGSLLWENDYIWGTSRKGGSMGGGYLFRIKSDGTLFEIVHDHVTDRLSPEGGLLVNNGKIWGLANDFSGDIQGGIYSIDVDGTNHTMHHTFSFNTNYLSGVNPSGTLLDYDGKFYGVTFNGGSGGTGVIFKISNDGTGYEVINEFDKSDGYAPIGNLVEGEDKIFGIASEGGKGFGVIFSINKDGSNYTKIHEFDQNNYHNPREGLVIYENELYGSTAFGGTYGYGGIFKIKTDGLDYTEIRDFQSSEINARITTLLGNKLWGNHSGIFFKGAVFSINLDGSDFQNIFDFNGTNGDLIVGKYLHFNNKLWGVTRYGGENNLGVIFSIDPAGNNFEIVHHFDGINGSNPSDALVLFGEELWGTTHRGGAENRGTVYRIDDEGIYEVVYSFSNEVGVWPQAALVENYGTLYGTTRSSGGGSGSLYKIDPETLNFTKITAFSSEFGGRPSITPIIIKDYQDITFDAIEAKIYGDDSFTLSATSNSVNPITFSSSDESIISIAGDQATIEGAGEVTLYATQLEYENYHAGQAEQTIIIDKAQISAKATDKEMVYGADLPELDINYTGFVNGDTELDITEPDISTLATSTSDVNDYEITLSGGFTTNYELFLNPGTLTIMKATLEISANNKEVTYGDDIPVLDMSYDGFLNSDTDQDITVPSIFTVASSLSDAGNYEIALSGGSAINYELILNPGTLTIGKAILEVVANNKEMVYGDDLPELDIAYAGFLNDDTEQDITEPVISTMASSTSGAGNYEITLSGVSAANYELVLNPGTLTIGKASLEAVANNKEMVYGDDLPDLDIAYIGFFNDDSELDITEPVISTMASSQSGAGNYEIALSGGSAANYELSLNPGTLSIKKAPQSIEFEALSTISTEQNEIVLSAESSSGLVVIFESTDESVLSIDGNLGTIVGAGIVEIIAKQPGNNNYLEAEPVSRVLTIEQVLGLDIVFELNVYPNPFYDYFIVKSPVNSGTIEGLNIFNSKGVSIPFELIDQGTQLMIKPKQLEPGLYFTRFKVDGKTYNQRLIFK